MIKVAVIAVPIMYVLLKMAKNKYSKYVLRGTISDDYANKYADLLGDDVKIE